MTVPRDLERLSRENDKLQKINRVLMGRVERSMNQETSDFALFERAILLEGEVKARTLALEGALSELRLSHAALTAAKSEAERANSSKTRFLAAASHDLLQPLQAARLFVAALAETEQSPDNRALIENIDETFASLEAMLSALLEISRLDSGPLSVQLTDLWLDELLSRLVTEFATVAQSKGLRLRRVPSGAVVRTDRQLIGRVLRNLLSNAIRYTRRGGVLLGARRRGDHCQVEVVDSGIGIPPEQQGAIFEEFRRLGQGRDGGPEGFGLGLAVVSRILERLDHNIEVHSIPGRGSRFVVSLPLGSSRPTDTISTEPVEAVGGPVRRGATVLVIENDAVVREGMAKLLEAWGYSVVTSASGRSGLETLQAAERRPDLIIADYHLDDGQAGSAAIETVRRVFGESLPAFVITANHSSALREQLAERGLAVLTKPIKPAKLRAILSQLITGPNLSGEGGRV